MTTADRTITLGQYRAVIAHQLQACGLPRTSWETITEFIMAGRPMDSFLNAVFSHDLVLTVIKADDLNIQRLRDYVQFLQSCAPAGCHGSPSAVVEWQKSGGLMGLTQNLKVVVPDRPVE